MNKVVKGAALASASLILGSIVVPTATQAATYKTINWTETCLLYTSPSPRDGLLSRMPSSA